MYKNSGNVPQQVGQLCQALQPQPRQSQQRLAAEQLWSLMRMLPKVTTRIVQPRLARPPMLLMRLQTQQPCCQQLGRERRRRARMVAGQGCCCGRLSCGAGLRFRGAFRGSPKDPKDMVHRNSYYSRAPESLGAPPPLFSLVASCKLAALNDTIHSPEPR